MAARIKFLEDDLPIGLNLAKHIIYSQLGGAGVDVDLTDPPATLKSAIASYLTDAWEVVDSEVTFELAATNWFLDPIVGGGYENDVYLHDCAIYRYSHEFSQITKDMLKVAAGIDVATGAVDHMMEIQGLDAKNGGFAAAVARYALGANVLGEDYWEMPGADDDSIPTGKKKRKKYFREKFDAVLDAAGTGQGELERGKAMASALRAIRDQSNWNWLGIARTTRLTGDRFTKAENYSRIHIGDSDSYRAAKVNERVYKHKKSILRPFTLDYGGADTNAFLWERHGIPGGFLHRTRLKDRQMHGEGSKLGWDEPRQPGAWTPVDESVSSAARAAWGRKRLESADSDSDYDSDYDYDDYD